MKIYYYYHIPKTGGTSILSFFEYLNKNVPRIKLYDFCTDQSEEDNIIPKDIPFNKILSLDNIKKKKKKYDYILIHHHHGYFGLMHYEDIILKKKKELELNGHTIKIFTTIRDVLSFNNSRLNYIKYKCAWNGNKSDFLNNNIHYNIQTKYFFFCKHGIWPSSEITIEFIENKLSKENILKISNVIDIFIETKNVTKFLDTMVKFFKVEYDSKQKKNQNIHLINFNNNSKELFKKNELDCFLLKQYANDENCKFII